MAALALASAFPVTSATAGWSWVASLPSLFEYDGNVAAAAGPDGRIYALGANQGNGSSFAAYVPEKDSWQAIAPAPNPSNGSAATTGADGHIYLMTGISGAVDVYDVCTGSWSAIAAMPERRQHMAAATGTDGRIYAIGGALDSEAPTNAVSVYDPAVKTWAPVAPMRTPRSGLAAVTLADGTIYAIGGAPVVLGGYSTGPLNTVEKYTPGAPGTPGTWTTVAGMTTGRYLASAALGADGLIYVMGGITGGSGAGSNSVETYDPKVDHWSAAVAPMSAGRQSLGATTGPDGRIYAIGGYADYGRPLHTVEAFPTGTGQAPRSPFTCPPVDTPPSPSFTPGRWTAVAPMHSPRTNLAAATGPDGRIYAIGGTPGNGYTRGVTTVEAYDPRTNSWTTVQPMHEGRAGLAATTGPDGKIYAVGGGPLSVEAYDTAKDEWQEVTPLPGLIQDEGAVTGPDGWIYELGGIECPQRYGTAICPRVGDVRRWKPGTDHWQDMAPMPNPNSTFGTALGGDGLIYTMGGGATGGSGGNTVQAYNVKNDSWSQAVAPMTYSHNLFPGASTLDGRVLAIGGGGPGSAAVEGYVGCANRWEGLAPMLTGRTGHAAATGPDGRIYVVGGTPSDIHNPIAPIPTSTVEAYTPLPPPMTAPVGCPSASISNAAPVGKDSYKTVYATFMVSIGPTPPTRSASVAYSTQDGQDGPGYKGAVAGRDYEQTAGVLQFPVGTTSRTISVPIDPTTRAGPETRFYVNLSKPTGVFLGTAQAVGTILASSDVPYSGPSLAIGDVSVTRTHATVVPAIFTVTLSGPAPTQRVTVDYVTRDGQGPNGAVQGTDYEFATGTLDFEPGDPPSQQIHVGIIGSPRTGGPDKTFSVVLSNPTNATVSRPVGTGTISDAADGLSIGNSTVVEPTTGSVPASFTVTLSDALTNPVTVDYTTVNGSATAGRDYRPTSGRLTFLPGDQELIVDVPVLADPTIDGTEQFSVTLTRPTGTVLSRATGTGTILENDVLVIVPGTPGTQGKPGYIIPGQQLPLTHSIVTTTIHQQAVQQAVQAQQQAQAQQQLQAQSQLQSQVQVQVQPGLMIERQRQIQLQKEGVDGRTLLASDRRASPAPPLPLAWVAVFAGLGVLASRRSRGERRGRARVTFRPSRTHRIPRGGRWNRRWR